MEKNVQWVVFDVGGVLLDWHGGVKNVSQYLNVDREKLLGSLGKIICQMEKGDISPVDGWQEIINDLDIKDSPKKVLKVWLDGCTWLPEVWELVKDLNDSVYKLAICSNNWRGITKDFWSLNPNMSLFKEIIDSSTEGVRKPDVELFRIVEKRLDTQGKGIYFIEDTEENCLAARNIDWQVHYFELLDDKGKTSCNKIRKDLL